MTAKKLIHKLLRLKSSFQILDDKIDLKQEVLADSIKAFDFVSKFQRRFDESFGQEFLFGKNTLELDAIGTLERVDFGGGDFGLRLTTEEEIVRRLTNLDTIFIREENSQLAGKKIKIISLESSTEIRLADSASFVGMETVSFKVQVSTVPAI